MRPARVGGITVGATLCIAFGLGPPLGVADRPGTDGGPADRGCSPVIGGQYYVGATNMACSNARRVAKHGIRGNDQAPKWNCTGVGTGFGHCHGRGSRHGKIAHWAVNDKNRQVMSEKTRVLCWNRNWPNEGPPDFFSAPRRCSLFRDGYDYEAAGAVHLRRLHWKHWGDRTTVAKGEYAEPMDIDDPWKPIRVRLKRTIESCGRTIYSKARFHVPGVGQGGGFPIWTC